MSKEIVLDIGIGLGGEYIRESEKLHPGERRIGIDVNRLSLTLLRQKYPETAPVLASGAKLPFLDHTINRIEVVLPFGDLLIPGVEIDHPGLRVDDAALYKRELPHGWYPEFSRVLIPDGILQLTGDLFLDPYAIEQTAHGFFSLHRHRSLSLDEYASLNTPTTRDFMIRYAEEFDDHQRHAFREGLIEVELRNRKQHELHPVHAIQAVSAFLKKVI